MMDGSVLISVVLAVGAIYPQTLLSQRRQNNRQSQATTLPQIGERARNSPSKGVRQARDGNCNGMKRRLSEVGQEEKSASSSLISLNMRLSAKFGDYCGLGFPLCTRVRILRP